MQNQPGMGAATFVVTERRVKVGISRVTVLLHE